MLRVAAYCRVSTDNDDQVNSFESQKLFFEQKIRENEDWILVDIYADKGISGTSTTKRTDFNRMIRDSKSGKIDKIITKEVSRFARNTVDVLKYTRELKELGVGVLFLTNNIDTLDEKGELILSMLASVAQEESRATSTRVKWGQTQRMKQGVVFGRNILGYHLEKGVLTINEEEAELVRHIYHKYLEGKGLHIIAKELREEGHKTKNGNSEWTNKSIRTILQNEKYVGDLLQKKTITPNHLTHKKKYNHGEEEMVYIKDHHEPIIDRETFEFVQSEFKRKSENYKKSKSKHSNRYAFSGKIKCGHCGRRYVATFKKRKDGTKRKIWNCYNKLKNGVSHHVNDEIVGCDNKAIGNDVLECAVLQALNEISCDKKTIINRVTKVINDVFKSRETQQYNFEKTEKLIARLDSKKLKIIDSYYDNEITKDEFIKLKEQYQEEIDKLNEEIKTERERNTVTENKDELIKDICSVVTRLVQFEEFDDSIAKEVLDQIVVNDKNDIEVYLKGVPDRKFFFTDKRNILDNNYRYQSAEPLLCYLS